MANKVAWQEKNKDEALKLMKELEKRIKRGEVIVTTCGFWSSGNGGTSTLRVDVKDSQSIALSYE